MCGHDWMDLGLLVSVWGVSGWVGLSGCGVEGTCVKIIGWVGLDEWVGGWVYQVVMNSHQKTYVCTYICTYGGDFGLCTAMCTTL